MGTYRTIREKKETYKILPLIRHAIDERKMQLEEPRDK